MAFSNLSKVLAKYFKGEQGESYVCDSIASLLRDKSDRENYYLIPKARLGFAENIFEIDLLLLHPTLGIFVVEVKNWDSLELIKKHSPYDQANKYRNLILSILKENFGDCPIPINVEMRVIFPSISKSDAEEFFSRHPYDATMRSLTFFKEDLQNKESFGRFFKSTSINVPNKKDFLKITSLFVSAKDSKSNQIIPIITKDEVVFFDHKQLGIMNGYKDGFRIIRGVAGTGKTIILTNFVAQQLKKDSSERFLILCFNNNLENAIKTSFGENYDSKQIKIISIMAFLREISFDFSKVGIKAQSTKEIQATPISKQYEIFESDEALKEFRLKLQNYLKRNPVDYMLCDETQDMPEGFMRILYEEIKDCIFFIDEAQRFYSYSMENIAQVFHHPKFEKISMQGRVKNLKNVYRTPSNIAVCAFKILNKDKKLNEYYKKSFYLKSNFTSDINCVLETGEIKAQNFNYKENDNLKNLLKNLPNNESNILLTFSNKNIEELKSILDSIGRKDIKIMTIQGIKGLEAQNVVVHGFVDFLNITQKYEADLLYRKTYVLLTRARENIYLDFSGKGFSDEVNEILKIIQEDSKQVEAQKEKDSTESKGTSKFKLAKICPILSGAKDSAEFIVAASEIFAVVAGLCAL